jgi:exopolyphosphatase / guanosine-5'-triphosphate,3'-diphosphate pyrophosphatase
MAEVVPRWEWRTFAGAFPRADVVIDAMTPISVEETDEFYLLARGGDNVKVRGGLMDVKVLRETDAAGLQRWEPILKATFPLDADAVRTVLQALRRPGAVLPPDGLDLDGLMEAAEIDAGDGPGAVRVHKRRARYTVAGCLAERTVVEAGGSERSRSQQSRSARRTSWPRSTR